MTTLEKIGFGTDAAILILPVWVEWVNYRRYELQRTSSKA